MSYHPTDIGLVVSKTPKKAAKLLLLVFREEGANAVLAAQRLSVSTRGFHRYVEQLGIKAEIDGLRAKARREKWLKSGRWPAKRPS